MKNFLLRLDINFEEFDTPSAIRDAKIKKKYCGKSNLLYTDTDVIIKT